MIVEVRTYRIKPERRGEFINFFETRAVPAQRSLGMNVVGPLLDLENPDGFVWLRSFPSLEERDRMKEAFYEGAEWKGELEAIAMPMLESYSVILSETTPGYVESNWRAEFLADLDSVESKISALAAAVPDEKYSWRPSAGVRSISEVYMHAANGNYLLATFLGEPGPSVGPKDVETITGKPEVLVEMKKSFEHVRRIHAKEGDASLCETVQMFGAPATRRRVFTAMLNHLHANLGQAIAYARMNGVVPPWSR